jgi:hypothetical protein
MLTQQVMQGQLFVICVQPEMQENVSRVPIADYFTGGSTRIWPLISG